MKTPRKRAGSFSLTQRKANLPSGTYVITDAQLSDRAENSLGTMEVG